MVEEFEKVDSIAGLYDEEVEARIYSINDRRTCFRHKWVNASLHWVKQIEVKDEGDKSSGSCYEVSLESSKAKFNREWGTGYGGIRFCKRCKLIDCIHLFRGEKVYRVYRDEFYYVSYSIEQCEICKRKILRTGCGVCNPSKEAMMLISEVAKELGISWTGDPRKDGFASSYYLELPTNVSRLLKPIEGRTEKQAEMEVRAYISEAFMQGGVNR